MSIPNSMHTDCYHEWRGSDTYAQIITATCVIINQPHKFQHPSWWYYRVYDIRNYEFPVVTHSMMSITNFVNFHPGILCL
jgi:hypothetical protein